MPFGFKYANRYKDYAETVQLSQRFSTPRMHIGDHLLAPGWQHEDKLAGGTS